MMHSILVFAGLIAGLALLMKGADIFVDAAVGIAHRLRLSPVIIGLTIVSMGTSIPELVISASAALGGANDLALANAVGANNFNLLMILGLAAIVRPFSVQFGDLSRGFWLSVGAAVFLLAFSLLGDGIIPRAAAVAMLVGYGAYVFFLVRQAPRMAAASPDAPSAASAVDEAVEAANERRLGVYVLIALLACMLIFVGGQLTVWAAENLGPILGLSERVIGLTIVSISTSLPELIITLIACKRGENEMAVGTIIGSNVFNLMAVLGVSGALVPLAATFGTVVDLSLLVGGSLLFMVFITTRKRLSRWEGVVMSVIYVGYLVFLLAGGAVGEAGEAGDDAVMPDSNAVMVMQVVDAPVGDYVPAPAPTPEPTPEPEPTPDPWRMAYVALLHKFFAEHESPFDESWFLLYDIDRDGVPEVIVLLYRSSTIENRDLPYQREWAFTFRHGALVSLEIDTAWPLMSAALSANGRSYSAAGELQGLLMYHSLLGSRWGRNFRYWLVVMEGDRLVDGAQLFIHYDASIFQTYYEADFWEGLVNWEDVPHAFERRWYINGVQHSIAEVNRIFGFKDGWSDGLLAGVPPFRLTPENIYTHLLAQ